MVNRIRNILLLLIFVGIAVALVLQNLSKVTFELYPGQSFELYTGLLVLFAFTTGALVSFLGLVIFGVRAYFREKALQGKSKKLLDFINNYLSARERSFLEPGPRSDQHWKKLSKSDPSDLLAKLEYAKRLLARGEKHEALSMVEAIRAKRPESAEALYLAAQINSELGNNTAALDNLALILGNHESAEVARMARDLSSELGRFQDAIEYHDRLRDLRVEDSEVLNTELSDVLLKQALSENSEGSNERISELKQLVRKYPKSEELHIALAEAQVAMDKKADAADSLVKIAKVLGKAKLWVRAAELQVKAGSNDKALSILRTAERSLEGIQKAKATLARTSLLLSMGRTSDAENCLESFDMESLGSPACHGQAQLLANRYLLLKGFCLVSQGKGSEAIDTWRESAEELRQSAVKLLPVSTNGKAESSSEQPAPRLSTP